MNGHIVETGREQLGQLGGIDGEFAATSSMRSSCYSCEETSLVGLASHRLSQQQHIQNASPRRKSR